MHSARVPLSHEGRFAIVTDVESGMRWTLRRQLTSDVEADGKIVWSWHPDAGVKSLGDDPKGDGGYKARYTEESTS